MSAAPLVIEVILAFFIAAFLLYKVSDVRRQNVVATVATFIAWYFSFLIIFILPLDVAATSYNQCLFDQREEPGNDSASNDSTSPVTAFSSSHAPSTCVQPWSYVNSEVLENLWRVIYWTSQALTWIMLPFMQSFSNAGNFTVLGKMRTALIENAIYYGTYLLIFGILLIYVATHISIDGAKLKVICITASNTWGLTLLVLAYGYGLVEIPRSCWNSSRLGYSLQKAQFKAAKLSVERSEAEEELEDVLDEVKKLSERIRYNNPLRKYFDVIMKKCPEQTQSYVQRRTMDDYQDFRERADDDPPTEKSLVALHKRLIKALANHARTQSLWSDMLNDAYEFEDIEISRSSPNRQFVRQFSATTTNPVLRRLVHPTVEWYWHCFLKAWVNRTAAVLLALVTVMVVWSEVTFFNKEPVLSLFAVFIDLARTNYNYLWIELISILTIAYLCICAYYTIFKLRIFNYYYLTTNHMTNANSLIFSGMLACRFTPPLCLNFLGLIHLDSHITKDDKIEETAYTKIMGHMDVIPFISDGFNIYFPMLICLLCAATYFRLGSKCLHFLGFQQFIGDDDLTQELVDEGKELIKRELRKRERKEVGDQRRKQWEDKYGDRRLDARLDRASHKERPLTQQNSDERDRTLLLENAEPIDFREEDYGANPLASVSSQLSSYQSDSRNDMLPRRANRGADPPRNLFDDV